MQRQLRLGDTLDDYCPRERRVTNHAVVAMVGDTVKQTRCTTCDAEHEYKHAKVPRQRRKADAPAALYSQVLAAAAPKRHEQPAAPLDAGTNGADAGEAPLPPFEPPAAVHAAPPAGDAPISADADEDAISEDEAREGGPVHRPLIRASLPRPEGQPPQSRPLPEFTIRQPGNRPNRFRPRHARGPQLQGNRPGGPMSGGAGRGGLSRPGGGRPPSAMPRLAKRHGPGRNKRSK